MMHIVHQHDIIHRDIKPENILLSNQTIKLVDFGSATRISEKISSHIGSPAFMAPELLKKGKRNMQTISLSNNSLNSAPQSYFV